MFDSVGLPHGFCFLWNPGLLWLHVLSDSLIALAYFLIPIALLRVTRKRKDIPFNGVFFCFAAFIVACGITHAMDVVTLWHPIYWVSGILKACTAAISILTLVVLVRTSPAMLAMPHRLADRRFRELIEDAPDGILQVDEAGTILIANRTAEQMFGYSREELLNRNVDLLIPHRDRAQHPEHRKQFVKSGVSRLMGKAIADLHARRKDGTELSVEIGLSPVETEKGTHVTAVIRDITERRRTEKELERVSQQLNSVIEATHLGIYALDRDWRFQYINEDAKRMLKTEQELLGKDIWTSFPNIGTVSVEHLRRVMVDREPADFESLYEPLDLWTHVSVYPWKEDGLTVFFNDISERKRLELALEKERSLAGQRTEVLARLSSGLAHEIRNPLAIIVARTSDLAELAEEGNVDPAEIGKTCTSILRTADRAIRILRGIAAMARVGSHDPMQQAEIGGIVQQAVDLVEGRYKAVGIRLETTIQPEMPLLECREVQVGQILVNLLNNAFDAIESDPRSERWVRLAVSLQSASEHEDNIDRLQVDVLDGGPGVRPEHRERLMQTFFTTKSSGAGIGIGLSVSRTIAEDHGGQLELTDCDGHTCFRLTLPVKAASAEGVAA